jgi:hypothetical protein
MYYGKPSRYINESAIKYLLDKFTESVSESSYKAAEMLYHL